ncbi:ergothioneine biosynthesis protein EgtB [Flavobacteriaceae bacterium MAR_2010_188]|nr:ergothioneine biosynthesis protein EgtB [Flavobacteriaceae bacterium MAR_2010_188]
MTKEELLISFKSTRKHTEDLCISLKNEDYSVQPVDFVSPPKWHLAHSTWFFEQFVLHEFIENYKEYDQDFSYLFNSYYNNIGARVLRPNRGNMTRPSVDEVFSYRAAITANIEKLIFETDNDEVLNIVEIGINHEQQHQELLAYDIKYILGNQPTFPKYETTFELEEINSSEEFIQFDEGVYEIGHKSEGFSFDNEHGKHKVYLNDFNIRKTLVTNKEYLEFIEDGGYENFNLWHADGWEWINSNQIKAPMYWHKNQGSWFFYDYSDLVEVIPNQAVSHISFYEAYAFAEWKKMRIPTEFEWEVASTKIDWGQLWEWTNSAYLPYPNFKTADGALGEYNGKFMINQMVLRGSAITTPKGHERHTYRNFFQPDMRWMFSGIRLAK